MDEKLKYPPETALLTSVPSHKLFFPGQMLESAKLSARTTLCPLRVLTTLKGRRRSEKNKQRMAEIIL